MECIQQQIDAAAVAKALRGCIPVNRKSVDLHSPCFEGNEWTYVKQCLDTKWVSSAGSFVNRLESMLVDFTGAKHAVAVVNGTSALHAALVLLGVKAGEEVLVPALTFVAPVNAIAYCGAVPHFVDSEEETLGVDFNKLEKWLSDTTEVRRKVCINKNTGRRIRALMVVHTLGHPVDLDRAVTVCDRFSLELIEDAAESLGSFYKGKHTGNWGVVSILSFNGNKTVTTGGGGAILTNKDQLGNRARHITSTAKVPHAWKSFHDCVGFNYRMPNINAALGCAQMEQLEEFLRRKRTLAERYKRVLANTKGLRFFTEPKFASSNYWLNAILLDQANSEERDELLKVLNEEGLQSRPAWTLMHRLPMYADCPRMDLSRAENLEARLIEIPSGADL